MLDARIRPAEPADARAVAELGHASWREAYRGLMPDELIESWSVERRLAHMQGWPWVERDPERRVWLVEHDGRVAGFAVVRPAESEAERAPPDAQIDAFYVHPDHWRRGLGSHLMRHVLDDLRQRAQREVLVWCLADNAPARRFYETFGFQARIDRAPRLFDGYSLDHTLYQRPAEGRPA